MNGVLIAVVAAGWRPPVAPGYRGERTQSTSAAMNTER